MSLVVKGIITVLLLGAVGLICYFIWASSKAANASSTTAPLNPLPTGPTTTPAAPTATPITASPPAPATITFYTGQQGTGTATPITSVSQVFSIQGAIASASVSNGGSFNITATASDGTSSTWSMTAGQTGFTNAPAALSSGAAAPKTIAYTVNGQSQSVAPNGASAATLTQLSNILASIQGH